MANESVVKPGRPLTASTFKALLERVVAARWGSSVLIRKPWAERETLWVFDPANDEGFACWLEGGRVYFRGGLCGDWAAWARSFVREEIARSTGGRVYVERWRSPWAPRTLGDEPGRPLVPEIMGRPVEWGSKVVHPPGWPGVS